MAKKDTKLPIAQLAKEMLDSAASCPDLELNPRVREALEVLVGLKVFVGLIGPTLKTPEEWEKETGVTVTKSDGWTEAGVLWSDRIDRATWERLLISSSALHPTRRSCD